MTGCFAACLFPLISQALRLNLASQPLLAFQADPGVACRRFRGKQTSRSVGLSPSLSLSPPTSPVVFSPSQPYPQLAPVLMQTYLTVLTKTFWVYYLFCSATGFAL